MSTRIKILSGLLLITAVFIAVVVGLFWRIDQEAALVEISTDRREYREGDTIQVSIRNQGAHSINLYCPASCALGNFPTTVEKYASGKWLYYAGFCPSIEPLFGSGITKGNYILHTLSAQDSFELELSNLKAFHLAAAESFRIVYYVGIARKPVYSNLFIVMP